MDSVHEFPAARVAPHVLPWTEKPAGAEIARLVAVALPLLVSVS